MSEIYKPSAFHQDRSLKMTETCHCDFVSKELRRSDTFSCDTLLKTLQDLQSQSCNSVLENTMDRAEQSMMHFEDYCKMRSSIQMQLMINGRLTKVFSPEDPLFAGLILMEQQWQYACKVPSMPSFNNRGSQFFNGFFGENSGSANIAAFNFSSSRKGKRGPRSGVQKRRIRKYEGKPKKPLTSFMLFLKDFRKTLVSTQTCQFKISPHEINKLAGKQWHLLPENIKHQYKEEAAKALAKWQEENFVEEASSVKQELNFPMEDAAKKTSNDPAVEAKAEGSRIKTLTDGSSSSSGETSSSDSNGSDSDSSSN